MTFATFFDLLTPSLLAIVTIMQHDKYCHLLLGTPSPLSPSEDIIHMCPLIEFEGNKPIKPISSGSQKPDSICVEKGQAAAA